MPPNTAFQPTRFAALRVRLNFIVRRTGDGHVSLSEFKEVAAGAIKCRDCFLDLGVDSPKIDLAQPRWVGPAYWSANPRVVVVMLNPGAGASRHDSADDKFRNLLHRFSRSLGSIDAIFAHQRKDIASWGRGRFRAFYLTKLGLDLDTIAFANIAWCATVGNRYPTAMLTRCFSLHTSKLLKALDPGVVLLSGSSTHRFSGAISQLVPRNQPDGVNRVSQSLCELWRTIPPTSSGSGSKPPGRCRR
jgi:hypothetical protein